MRSVLLRHALAAVLLLPAGAIAADEPEVAYGKYHRAAVTGDLAEMQRYLPAQQRNQVAAMSEAQKDAETKMLAATMPRAFTVKQKVVNPDGRGARLIVSGPEGTVLGARPTMLYGMIRMEKEQGEWKVSETNWSNEQPAPLTPARAAGAAGAAGGAAPQKAAARAPGSPGTPPVVGSMSGAPERKLGTARPPCVYKPVMTAEDLENCR